MSRKPRAALPDGDTPVAPAAVPRTPGVLGPGAAAAMLVLAALVFWRSLHLGLWTSLGPGPGFLPLSLAVLLGGLALTWLVQQLRSTTPRRPATPATDAAPPDGPAGQEVDRRYLLGSVAALVVLAGTMELLGYQLSMLLFLLFHLRVLGRRGWLLSVLLAVLGSFGVFVLFTRALTVNLPASSLDLLRGLGL